MVIVESYPVAVAMCVVTMLCWGSWANTRKLTQRQWPFQLFYWDYAIGVLLLSVILAVTLGSLGSAGRPFLADLVQGEPGVLFSAFLGGVIFNLANILLVAAIDIAGMAVAFPVGVGLALVMGVVVNYLATPIGNPVVLSAGVAAVVLAIIIDAFAYRALPSASTRTSQRGVLLAIVAGVTMGLFYRFVAASMASDFVHPEPGRLGPYSALVVFAVGLFLSSFLWNSLVMARPFVGPPVGFRNYFIDGDTRLHAIGLMGGAIWGVGMAFSIIAAGAAGFAISYGLGQGATLVAALWGVLIWREFDAASPATKRWLDVMFGCYLVGLVLIIVAR